MNAHLRAMALFVALPACTSRATLPAASFPLVATRHEDRPLAPPVPPLRREPSLPATRTHTLPNGMRAYVVAHPGASDISVTYVARAGGENRNLKTLGLSTLAIRAVHIAREQEAESAALAAERRIDMRVERDAALLETSAHRDTLAPVLADLAETLRSPPLTRESIASAVTEQLDLLHDGLFDQRELGRLHAMQMLYGDRHPLGTATAGLHENMFRFKVNELDPHLTEILAPDTSALLISGDVDMDATVALVERHFSSLSAVHAEQTGSPASAPSEKKVRALLTPGRIAHIVQAYRAPPSDHADAAPFYLLSIAAGELSSSRLNLALREQHEHTYSVSSQYAARPEDGTFTIETEVAARAVGDTLQHIDETLERLRAAPVDAHELERAKLHARERVAALLESGEGTARLFQNMLINGQVFPQDLRSTLERDLARIGAATAADLQRVANNYLWPGFRGAAVSGPLGDYHDVLARWCNDDYDMFVPKRLKQDP